MKIAQIAPIVERLPPKKYGGTERVIYHLTEELVRRGHDVTLFASGDSHTSARLVSVVPKSLRELPNEKDIYGFNTNSLHNIGLAYSMQEEFDVIHDHNPHMSLPTANIATTPVVMTWHGPYDAAMTRFFESLDRPNLVSISHSQAKLAPSLPFVATVHNGLPMEQYPWSATPGEYLLFVGRIDEEKGVHHAIDAAVQSGKQLIIAAKLDDSVPHIKRYFMQEIEPRLRKHKRVVRWVGEVDESERNKLMQKALCLLHPVTWPEPFGLVLIEAMACGTPVIAFNQGAIPEIVRNGTTGFVVENVEEMVDAIRKVSNLDRQRCRIHALQHFSATRMAEGYERVYEHVSKVKRTAQKLHQENASRIPTNRYASNRYGLN